MNAEAIHEFAAKFNRQFPEYGRWLLQGLDRHERKAQIDAWALCLSDVDSRDADAALERLIRGEDKLPEAYERSRFPAAVRDLCREAYARRSRVQARREEIPGRSAIAGGAATAIYRRVLELIDGGAVVADAVDQVMAEQPKPDPSCEPRYDCLTCRDEGLVTVWHTSVLVALLRREFDERRHSQAMVVPCSCRAGRVRLRPGRWGESAVYGDRKYCLYGAVADLKDWVAMRQVETWERRRFKEFDGWRGDQQALEA